MRIILEYDPATQEVRVTEEGVTQEFAYSAIPYYLAMRCNRDVDDRDQGLARVRNACAVASGLVKEKYQENAGVNKAGNGMKGKVGAQG